MSKKKPVKATDGFTQVIKEYLDKKALSDFTFLARLELKEKTLDSCVGYILNKVQKSGMQGYADQEIFDMAVFYYENDIEDKDTKGSASRVVVNHHVAKPKKADTTPKANAEKEAVEPVQKFMDLSQYGKAYAELQRLFQTKADMKNNKYFIELCEKVKDKTGYDVLEATEFDDTAPVAEDKPVMVVKEMDKDEQPQTSLF